MLELYSNLAAIATTGGPLHTPFVYSFPAKWHATQWRGACSTSGGISLAQRSAAIGHRVRNRQPLGTSIALGGSPVTRMRSRLRSTAASGIGAAEIRDFVYGCKGASKRSAALATSITLPRYRTTM